MKPVNERCVAVKQRQECFIHHGMPTHEHVTTAEIESGFVSKDDPGSIPLQSIFFVRDATPKGCVNGRGSGAVHVMGAVIANFLQPRAFVWFEKTQGTPVKALTVPGWWPMKLLAVRAHFLRCGCRLDDLSFEGVLSLVFV
ncbi:uncharacterized protein TNCV_296401 [Trichonephila clavipes]|nr:uncharacterized protein TNCV_296401 [Trichonephila clavipes]